jgi:uncharacterized protein YecT (DUF1311 family)
MVFGAVLLLSPAARAESKLAFVVGIDAYPNLGEESQLQRAANDAETVGDSLGSLGFTVTKVVAPAETGLDAILAGFGRFASTISPGDTVVFFYAGHGVSLDDGTYLLPSDIPALGPTDAMRAKRAAIAEKDVTQQIKSAGARVAFVVIDACRDNPFPKRGSRAIGSSSHGLGRLTPAEGTYTLYSAREGQTALDRASETDPSRNSVFTRVFVQHLTTPGLSLSDLGEVVRDEVAALARSERHDQVPAVYNDLVGARNVYLAGHAQGGQVSTAGRPVSLQESASQVQSDAGARADFALAKQVASVEMWQAFRRKYPSFYPAVVEAEIEGAVHDRKPAGRKETASTGEPALEGLDFGPPPDWCRTARRLNAIEAMICSDPQLSRLDDRLNRVFSDRLQSASAAGAAKLKQSESDWVTQRDESCATLVSQSMKECLANVIRSRISALSRVMEEAPEPTMPPQWCRAAVRLKPTEILICSDARLSSLDETLTRLYRNALEYGSGSARRRLIDTQRDWVSERDRRCGMSAGRAMMDCILGMMEARISTLRRE